MAEDPGHDPGDLTADVTLVLNQGTWEIPKTEQEIHKEPGKKFVIEAPQTLPDTNWKVWFNPAGPFLEPDKNQVVVEISQVVPYEKDPDRPRTWYKYTIEADGQVIDPKIIIDPPTT